MMNINQKTLKHYSIELCDLLEEAMVQVLENEVKLDWQNFYLSIQDDIKERALKKAKKNNRSEDFSKFSNFKQNLDFSDATEIIISLSKKADSNIKRFFKNPLDKQSLQQSTSQCYFLRNLTKHSIGKTVFVSDIRDFLIDAIKIAEILEIYTLRSEFSNIERDIEGNIFNSDFFIKENKIAINYNLPIPDYESWKGFIGRQEIKNSIIDNLSNGYDRMIAITGGGGIGKSALAINIGYEFIKSQNATFKNVIWVTSKSDFLDGTGIHSHKPKYYYSNNYKDFLNQLISGFYQELFAVNIEEEEEGYLEKQALEILNTNTRVLIIIDNLENIDDPQIINFLKEKIVPPNKVLITSRRGLGEINKVYTLNPLSAVEAKKLFDNLSLFYNIPLTNITDKKIQSILIKTNNYPLVIKWFLGLIKNGTEIEKAIEELDKPQSDLVEFIFRKLYQILSKQSKGLLRFLAKYKNIPDRSLIAYMADIEKEEELEDCIIELEQHALVSRNRVESKTGIIETLNLLPLATNFIKNLVDSNTELKRKIEERITEVDREINSSTKEKNKDYRPAQKLAQSRLLNALSLASDKNKTKNNSKIENLIKEAERLAPRFYLIPFYKGLIELTKNNFEYSYVKRCFEESLNKNNTDGRVVYEYAKLIKKKFPKDYKEYAPYFSKAFRMENKIGYGIEASIAYSEWGYYEEANNIIEEIKKRSPEFPNNNQYYHWIIKTYLFLSEKNIDKSLDAAEEYLIKAQELLYKEDAKETKALESRFFSDYSMIYLKKADHFKAKEMLKKSNSILESLNKDNLFNIEISCQNIFVDISLNTDNKVKKISSIENIINKSTFKNDLVKKFGEKIKRLK